MTLSLRLFVFFYLLASAGLLSFLLVPPLKNLAFRRNILDYPEGRKAHPEPTPLLGGLAISGSFAVVVLANLLAFFIFGRNRLFAAAFPVLTAQYSRIERLLPVIAALLCGAAVVSLTGLIDDIRGVHSSPKLKLTGQTAAALIAVAAGIQTSFMPGRVFDWVISLLWIVGVTNAFNLLDHADGVSAGVGAIASLVLCGVVASQGQVITAFLLAVLAGSLIGFLRYNFPPASVFMGDAGSLFLGYVLSCLTLVSSYVTAGSSGLLPVISPLLILAVPLFDTASVICIRLSEHRPIWVGDRRHISHRLMDLGLSARQALVFLYLVTLGVGIAAALLPSLNIWQSLAVLALEIIFFGLIVSLVRVHKNDKDGIKRK